MASRGPFFQPAQFLIRHTQTSTILRETIKEALLHPFQDPWSM